MQDLEQLYTMYRQDLYRYLCSLTRSEAAAEELLAETFYQALRALPGYRGDAPVKTWLFGIAHNVWRKSLRGRPWQQWPERTEPAAAGDLEEQAAHRQAAARALELLEEKDERTRGIVKMRLAGWPFAQIAARFGVSEASARVIDFRARRALREVMEQEGLL